MFLSKIQCNSIVASTYQPCCVWSIDPYAYLFYLHQFSSLLMSHSHVLLPLSHSESLAQRPVGHKHTLQIKKLRARMMPQAQEPPPYSFWSVPTGSVCVNNLVYLTSRSNTSSSSMMSISSYSSSSSAGNTLSSTRSPGEDRKRQIRLATNPKEREQYDHLANLYSIIRTVEALEKLWSHNIIPHTEYDPSGVS